MGIDAQMFVKVLGTPSDEEIKRWSYIFGSAFHNYLFLGFENTIHHKPLEKIDEYRQDGDSIFPNGNETFLEVPLSYRYYGEGYERGPLLIFISMAEFLEKLIPNCKVYYGGDSSGIEAKPFNAIARHELLEHFVKYGNDPYNRLFDKENDGPNCPVCDVKMIRTGWGMNFKSFSCIGCGWYITKRDGEKKEGFSK